MASKNQEIAQQVVTLCNSLGWEIKNVSSDVFKIQKRILSNSNDSFSKADSEYFSILCLIPKTSPGSIWGTDGGSIGALSAMSSGIFSINMSGCSIRVLNAIKKII